MNETQQLITSRDGAGECTLLSRHAWYRLHFSTWAVIAAVLAVLTLITVPGRINNHGVLTSAPLYYEHGWPFVFLDRYNPFFLPPGSRLTETTFQRDVRDSGVLRLARNDNAWSEDRFMNVGPPWLDADYWPLKGGFVISWYGLAIDFAVVVFIVAAFAFVYEWWARRCWRYSLRCLLGGIFVASAALAWWRFSINASEREWRAVSGLVDKGVRVEWRSDFPVWLGTLLGANQLRPFQHVACISVDREKADPNAAYCTAIADTDLEHLNVLLHLQFLLLDCTPITDEGLKSISGEDELEVLRLGGTRVTDAGLEYIHNLPRLRFLALDNNRIEGTGFRYFHGLPKLSGLSLDNTQITDDTLSYLKKLPKLQDLSLNGTQITDAGIPQLKALTELKIIRLDGTKITDSGLELFKGAMQLERLQLNGTSVTDEGIKKLQGALPNCKIEWQGGWER
jgi:hypothetical protein